MKIFILFVILLLPSSAFGQSFEGSYRAVFFNLFSGQKMIVAEFAVKADNSLSGKIKIDESVKTFSGTVDKKGKFEAVIEQNGNFTYKLKGKFDKDNKISLVQRNQSGSGLNRGVSESAIEGNFSKVTVVAAEPSSASSTDPQDELMDSGKSWLKIEHSSPLFGSDWTDFTASVGFDRRLAEFDIEGSVAHARMLHAAAILSAGDLAAIERGLAQIRDEIRAGHGANPLG